MLHNQFNISAFLKFKEFRPAIYRNGPECSNLVALSRICQIMLAVLSLSFFTSCSTQGDFGRDEPSVLNDEIIPAIAVLFAQSRGRPITDFVLTESEELLRNHQRRIARNMKFAVFARYYTPTIESIDVPEDAKTNPFDLRNEIEEDITIIRRVIKLGQLIHSDDELRSKRIAILTNLRQMDRDNVVIRAQDNWQSLKFIQHVARLRVMRYRQVIDVMSITDPTLNLKPVKTAVRKLEFELHHFSRLQQRHRRSKPMELIKTV